MAQSWRGHRLRLESGGPGERLDRAAYRALNRDRGPVADALLKSVTELGSIWASAGATLTLARSGRKRVAVDAMSAAVAMWLVGQGLKKAVRRPRPYCALEGFRLLIAEPNGTSWPSSHPAVLLTFAMVASRDLGAAPGSRAALRALAWVVGLSRVYLGVHYPADVVGGLLLGEAVSAAWSAALSPVILGSKTRSSPDP